MDELIARELSFTNNELEIVNTALGKPSIEVSLSNPDNHSLSALTCKYSPLPAEIKM